MNRLDRALDAVSEKVGTKMHYPMERLSPSDRKEVEEYLAVTEPAQQFEDFLNDCHPLYRNYAFIAISANLSDDELQQLYLKGLNG